MNWSLLNCRYAALENISVCTAVTKLIECDMFLPVTCDSVRCYSIVTYNSCVVFAGYSLLGSCFDLNWTKY